MHGIAAGKGKEDFIKSNFALGITHVNRNGRFIQLIGQVHEEASKLLFYASVNGNGDFYFDDVNFYIEECPGKWKQLALIQSFF